MIAFAWNKDVVIPTCFKWESQCQVHSNFWIPDKLEA